MPRGKAPAPRHGAHFVVWLYLQVDEGGTQTGQERVVSVPYDAHMTFDNLATQAFEKAHAMLRACCEIDSSTAAWRRCPNGRRALNSWQTPEPVIAAILSGLTTPKP
ncbi:MAG: hypothetical protein E5Y63_19295 [Mesorhizobium sp.]|uniref:hypothetical protein n=1 Tax=Mesorhizobium TaxID=68287 RepID=UPI000FE60ABF|nr:hypothetical protein [Mesorhizobium sp.]RWP39320.1 MAG: hypothetical protein EOR04_23295 [Mesorhizobium sp.]TIM28599.1 MAG: hypothetical protein E5Y63_19295 [Mesorhizobium sp.]TIM79205.1 MAG: hypothetical protein E5Y58_01660 [Mesorhizobium sp.]